MTRTIPAMELVDFLVAAKVATYATAGEGGERRRAEDGARELTFKAEGWRYLDVYHGSNPFVGRELIWHDEMLVWAMTYYGRVVDGVAAGEVYAFLKEALRLVEPSRPFRGPASYELGEWRYAGTSVGDVDRFSGSEEISLSGRLVYSLDYLGGTLSGAG